MHWVADAFWAHIGWAIGDAVIAIGILSVIGLLALFASAPRMIRQARCKHARYRETGSCDAICSDCGKNLGFIGSWREKQRAVS